MPARDPEQHILESWQSNAAAWTEAIDGGHIVSRRIATDAAIIALLKSIARPGARILDIGCGEGWLARVLASAGMRVLGIDATFDLVAVARARGGADFEQCAYEDIATGRWERGKFDAAVCNFSLLGFESVDILCRALPAHLIEKGSFVIQTLHPLSACGGGDYADGWREGTWAGFSDSFQDPAPWYFRTFATWLELLNASGFELQSVREPTARGAARPASIIFHSRRR